LVATGLSALGLGLASALGFACAGMVALGLAFNRVILRRLVGQPLISLIMVTLGVGALMRGSSALAFSRVPGGIPLSIPHEPFVIHGVPVAADKLLAAVTALLCVAAVSLFFRLSRAGVAMRALADDQQAAEHPVELPPALRRGNFPPNPAENTACLAGALQIFPY